MYRKRDDDEVRENERRVVDGQVDEERVMCERVSNSGVDWPRSEDGMIADQN